MSERVFVFSDTHGKRLRGALALLRALSPSAIVFLGDGLAEAEELRRWLPDVPLHLVRGNCDILSTQPVWRVLEIGGARIYAAHGHHVDVKSGLSRLAAAARASGCSVALYGHTHFASIETERGLLLVNPGSLGRPRGGNGTAALLMVEDGRVQATHLTI